MHGLLGGISDLSHRYILSDLASTQLINKQEHRHQFHKQLMPQNSLPSCSLSVGGLSGVSESGSATLSNTIDQVSVAISSRVKRLARSFIFEQDINV